MEFISLLVISLIVLFFFLLPLAIVIAYIYLLFFVRPAKAQAKAILAGACYDDKTVERILGRLARWRDKDIKALYHQLAAFTGRE